MSEHRSTKLASSSSGVYRGMLVVAEALPSEPQKGQKKEVFDDVTECWADAWVFRLRARPQHRCLSSRYCLRYIYSLCPSLEASKSWVPGVGAKGLCCAGERSGPSILVPERISPKRHLGSERQGLCTCVWVIGKTRSHRARCAAAVPGRLYLRRSTTTRSSTSSARLLSQACLPRGRKPKIGSSTSRTMAKVTRSEWEIVT